MNCNNSVMKNLMYLLMSSVLISCLAEGLSQEEIIENNPELIGNWYGVGGFLDMDAAKKLGDVSLEFSIFEEKPITGTIGDATISEMTLSEASYGFEINGILNSRIKEEVDFEKNHLIILLVLPKGQDRVGNTIDANFHLKSNFVFDFDMKVGGVYVSKTE